MNKLSSSYPSNFVHTTCRIIERFANTAFHAELPNGKKTVAFVELKNAALRDELQPGDLVKVTICPADFDRARIDGRADA
jgi:translation initiation factor IF-1